MEKKYIICGVFIIIFIGGLYFGVRLLGNEAKPTLLQTPQEPTPVEAPGPNITVKPQESYKGVTIAYSRSGFLPNAISLKQTDSGDGCYVGIRNKTEAPLVVRLSPPGKEDTYGYPYTPIAPGDLGIIDPRFGITDVAFYNRGNTAHEFKAHLDKSCTTF